MNVGLSTIASIAISIVIVAVLETFSIGMDHPATLIVMILSFYRLVSKSVSNRENKHTKSITKVTGSHWYHLFLHSSTISRSGDSHLPNMAYRDVRLR